MQSVWSDMGAGAPTIHRLPCRETDDRVGLAGLPTALEKHATQERSQRGLSQENSSVLQKMFDLLCAAAMIVCLALPSWTTRVGSARLVFAYVYECG